jgi:DNA polymerase V
MTLALIDGNAFYCSCERVFDPKVRTRPVIVLSNNDGCAVARTSEAKALGIKMGQPYFMIRGLCRREGVAVFSSNYTLYGDMSARMNAVYRQFSPEVETYSIDESFLDLSGFGHRDLVVLARDLRETVRRWVGIPTCVGLGRTKTLAKLANWIAKQVPELGGVCDLTDPLAYEHWLVRVPVEEVWGIGPASARKLQAMGVESAADLRDLDPRPVRQALTVVGERIVYELRGVPCLALEHLPAERKGCAVTRMFSRRVEDQATVLEAVAAYATRLGEKLRCERLGTDHVHVFFHTSGHDRDRPQHAAAVTVRLPEATSDTLALVAAAKHGARQVWREGHAYAKAGVITTDLVLLEGSQRALIGAMDRERPVGSWQRWMPATGAGGADRWCPPPLVSRRSERGPRSSRCAARAIRPAWMSCRSSGQRQPVFEMSVLLVPGLKPVMVVEIHHVVLTFNSDLRSSTYRRPFVGLFRRAARLGAAVRHGRCRAGQRSRI